MDAIARPAITTDDLCSLAEAIDRRGLAALTPDDLGRVAGLARSAGVVGPVVEVLLDPTAPEVVRSRAFGLIHRRVAQAEGAPRLGTGLVA